MRNDAVAIAIGALAGFAALKLVMLAALFIGTPPFPPPILAPLFGASLALSALAAALLWVRSPWFAWAVVPVILESLLSFGPHKLYPGDSALFAQSIAVYPAIIVGSCLIAVLAASAWQLAGSGSAT